MVYLVYMYETNENLNDDFNTAASLFEKEIPNNELFNLLKNGNIVEKQVAALKISEIGSYNDALILANNLIGQDGKVREAISLKLSEFKTSPFLHQEKIYDIFLQAIIDINGNICRNIISVIEEIKNDDNFTKYFCKKLNSLTCELIEKVKEFNFQDGKYKINKEVFKLYWCLETIYHLAEKFDDKTLKTILSDTKNIDEYTIREKTAKILSKNFDDKTFSQMRLELKQDKNYYVRRF